MYLRSEHSVPVCYFFNTELLREGNKPESHFYKKKVNYTDLPGLSFKTTWLHVLHLLNSIIAKEANKLHSWFHYQIQRLLTISYLFWNFLYFISINLKDNLVSIYKQTVERRASLRRHQHKGTSFKDRTHW